jgi:hypothetical protein
LLAIKYSSNNVVVPIEYFVSDSTTIALAYAAVQSEVLPLIKDVFAVLTAAITFIGVVYGLIRGRRVSDASKEEADHAAQDKSIMASEANFARIQDFIIRFIILDIVFIAWGIVQQIVVPVISATTAYFANRAQMPLGESWFATYGVTGGGSLVGVIGSLIIFYYLGWPLFRDITNYIRLRRT